MNKPVFNLPIPQPGQTTKELLDAEVNRVVRDLYPLNEAGAAALAEQINADADRAGTSKEEAEEAATLAQSAVNNLIFPSRAAAIAALATLSPLVNRIGWFSGIIPTAFVATVFVARATGATALPDVPGWLPDGPLMPHHFADVGDMTFIGIDDPLGPLRTGGTSDLDAFVAADDYAYARGLTVNVPSGHYFLDGGFLPKVPWVAENRYGPVVWSRYGLLEAGLEFRVSYAGWKGFRTIGQYDREGVPKPGNSGHLGSIFLVGDFHTGQAQTPIVGVEIDTLLVRARNTVDQRSDASIMCNGMGRVKSIRWKLGLWCAGSNVASGALIQHHWAVLLEDEGAWSRGEDPTIYPYVESYHPEDCSVEFVNEVIDAAAHNLNQIWLRSATISCHMGACSSRGVLRPIYDLAGDENNRIAVADQKGRVGLGNTQDLQNHMDCDPGALGTGENESYQMFSRGTSKVLLAPGGVVDLQDQYAHQATGAGLVLSASSGDQIVRGLFVDREGAMAPGPMRLIATSPTVRKALYWQQSSGGDIEIEEANRAFHLRQGYLDSLKLRTDLGPQKTVTPEGDFQLGYDSNNSGLVIETTVASTVLDDDLEFGDTVLRVVPFAPGIQRGTKIYINGLPLVTRRYYAANSAEIEIEPSPYEAFDGDPVRVELLAGIDNLDVEISSSEYGIFLRGGYINNVDLSKMSGQGRHAAWLQTHDGGSGAASIPSRMIVNGGRLPIIGRLASEHGATDCDTIRVNSKCLLVLNGVDIPNNPFNRSHLDLRRTGGSGPWAQGILVGCRIENPAKLVTATVKSESIRLHGCVDYNGAPVTIEDV